MNVNSRTPSSRQTEPNYHRKNIDDIIPIRLCSGTAAAGRTEMAAAARS